MKRHHVKSFDVIGYVFHAALYCGDCGAALPEEDPEGNLKHPLFVDAYHEFVHERCGTCGEFIVEGDADSEHYFVVKAVYNRDRQVYDFVIDDDTLVARFPEGSVWHDEQWHEHHNDVVAARDWDLQQRLARWLDLDNSRSH